MKQQLLILLIFFSVKPVFSQVPILNSLPGASQTIFLDFDGQTVDNTAWNYDGPIFCNPSGLTSAQITEVFNRVAEDYRPFTVNITTDSTKYFAAPLTTRMRVIVTVSSAWYGAAGGVSFVGSFTWGDDTPCFVFSQQLGFSVKFISEATSHEAGHTLGLYHQATYDANCVKTSDYNYGTGTGEISWAPIMGVGYYKNLTIWHSGPNPYGCNNIQNDITVITSAANTITLRNDDNNNSTANAPQLTISNNSFATTGIFERANDADLFKLVLPAASRVTFKAFPFNVGSQNAGGNADILSELYSSTMSLLKSRNPADSLQSTIDSILNAGTYYFRVNPVANTYAGTYGMSGEYLISGTVAPASTLPLRKLVLTGKANGKLHSLQWLIEADEQVSEATLEYSFNGVSFTSLSSSGNASGTYIYQPSSAQPIYYRLKAILDNHEKHFSKTIVIHGSSDNNPPKVVTNPVNNGTVVVTGSSDYRYTLTDMNGRTVAAGALLNGITTIPVYSIQKGMYLIRFTGNDGSSDVQKIIIQ